jgi:hypothetical protein
MLKIFSRKQPDLLLHIVNRGEDIKGRTDLSKDDQFLQVASLRLPAGKTFPPHQHVWKPVPVEKCIAQESWVVVQGSVKVSFYDIDGTHLQDEVIRLGDCSITFQGGHTYTILQEDTVVYEYKTGPYQGQELDKIMI